MLHYNKINVSERININKLNKLKECLVFHYWYFKGISYKFEPEVCNGRHDVSITAYEFQNIAILNINVFIIDVLYRI